MDLNLSLLPAVFAVIVSVLYTQFATSPLYRPRRLRASFRAFFNACLKAWLIAYLGACLGACLNAYLRELRLRAVLERAAIRVE
jgi:hypothetical protein